MRVTMRTVLNSSSLLIVLLTVFSEVCEARSTFNGQELQDLWPFLHRQQGSNSNPDNEVEQTFYPKRVSAHEEPSSRDLDIGFSVGENDEMEDYTNNINKAVEANKNFISAPREGYREESLDGNDFSIDVFADPAKEENALFGAPRRLVAINPIFEEKEPLKWQETWAPRYGNQNLMYWMETPLGDRNEAQKMVGRSPGSGHVPGLNDEPVFQDEGRTWTPRYWVSNPMVDSTMGQRIARRYPRNGYVPALDHKPMLQNEGWTWAPRYWGPIPSVNKGVAQGMVVDTKGYPAMISQPLVNKVGTMRLKSDRGYQLAMHVPPVSKGDRPGVLELDMKATLYRPIYY